MKGFLEELLAIIASLFANVARGIRPGVGAGTEDSSSMMRRSFVFHIHPSHVTLRALKISSTFGLGIIAATLFVILTATGALLMIYYAPVPEKALNSTLDIQHAVFLGGFVRALHRWAANAMVLVVVLHLLRVFLTAAYRGRALNWLIGLSLLSLTLGLAFTGYLLPWDQLSFWAVTVAANLLDHAPLVGGAMKRMLLGGDAVGGASLLRFYTLHVAVLPSLAVVLIALHLWRLRKDGGLARPSGGDDAARMIPAWPHLLLREAALMLFVMAAISIVSLSAPPSLGGAPDIHHPSDPEKTPWYFLFLQEMVSYSAPMGGFVFPSALLLWLLLIPFIDRPDGAACSRLGSRRERVGFALSLAVASVAFVVVEYLYHRPEIASCLSTASPVVRDIVNPAAFMLLLSVFAFFVLGAFSRTTRGAFLGALAVCLVAVWGFTVMGLCRGPGWNFFWPWETWPDV